MTKKRVFLYVVAGLFVLWAVLMAAAAIRIYIEGSAYQAQGHPEVWIFTKEKLTAAFTACLPVLLAAVAATIIGAFMGIRDEKQDKPSTDPDLIRIYKEEREAARKESDASAQEGAPKGTAGDSSTAGNPSTAGDSSTAGDHPGTPVNLGRARLALFVLAGVFIIAGVFNGSLQDVLIKAINICTECIGLG